MRRAWSLLFIILLAAGCSSHSSPAAKSTSAPSSDIWTLTCTAPNDPMPALLWNGLVGVRIGRNGSGMDPNGKPLGFFMCDEYDSTGEEKIRPMPNPILVTIAVGNESFDPKDPQDHDPLKSGGTMLDPRKGEGYSQILDMKAGTLTTSWRQATPEAGVVRVTSTTIVHPDLRMIGQRWTVKCEKDSSFSIKTLDYTGPTDDQDPVGEDQSQGLYVSSSKSRVVAMTFRLTGADVGAKQVIAGYRVQEGRTEGKPFQFERVLAFGPHSAEPLPAFASQNADELKKLTPKLLSFTELQNQTAAHWSQAWRTDIVIDGPAEDQVAIHSFLFYLRSAISQKSPMAISPFGLGSDEYFGHVFWDADVWVFPALDLIDPGSASAIPAYRLKLARTASANFANWVLAGKPVPHTNPVKLPAGTPLPAGIKYPWESSETGLETTPTDSRYEEHVTGSVVWGLTQATALGLVKAEPANQVAALAYNYFFVRSDPGPKGREIRHVMSPDENHIGPNDLYTNLLATWLTNGRHWPAIPNFKLPRDAKGFLNYDNDQFSGYKQAAGILSIYPLQYPPAEAEASSMVTRLGAGVLPDGPAMTDSLEGLIMARAGDPTEGYQMWQKGWEPYTNHPLMLFSERKSSKNSYLTTGAAGCLQTILYGFCGIRIDLKPAAGAIWSKPLLGQYILSVKPHLPPAWRSLKLQNFNVLGQPYTLTVTPEKSTVTQGE
jgi:trehalose/maltose hydrolase-like predicted phosphorylase